MFFNADKKSSLDSSCDRNVSFSKVIWVSCTMIRLKSSVESNRPVDLMSVALQRPRTRERRHHELRKRLLNEELISLPGPRKPKNREQILPTSFEPAMKPEYFFICGSSCSAQQIRSKGFFEDYLQLKSRKLTKFDDFSCALQIWLLGIPDKNTLYETYLYMSWAICQTPIWRWSHNLRDPKAHRRRRKFCIFTYY